MTINDLKHKKLVSWIEEIRELCQPDDVVVCDGSKEQYDQLIEGMIEQGLCVRLNEEKKPGCVLFDSDPSDVARVEKRTYIASATQEAAGPTNNWIDPVELKKTMTDLYRGCMKGRTMYVIPFSMGPLGSPIAKLGIELTDSAYVVCNMMIMTRVGVKVLDLLGEDGYYVPCLHSVGKPLAKSLEGVQTYTEYIADKVETLKDQRRDQLLNKIGTMTANINKRERVQVGEVNATVGQCEDYIYMFIDNVNRQFTEYGLPFEMKLNTSLEELYTDDSQDGDGTQSAPEQGEEEEINNA